MNTLINGNVPTACAAIKACQDKEMLAKWLQVEQAQATPRKGVLKALETAMKPASEENANKDNEDKDKKLEEGTTTLPVATVSKESQKPHHDKDNECWHVVATVNMPLKGGVDMLVSGKVCKISEEDYERLSKDARGPFWIN